MTQSSGEAQVRCDGVRSAALAGGIVLSTVVFSFHFTSFLHPKEAVLVLLLPVMAAVMLACGRNPWPGLKAFAPIWFLLIADAVIHLGIVPSQVPSDTLVSIARGATVLLLGACAYDLLREARRREQLLAAIIFAAACVAALAWVQYLNLLPGLFPRFPDYDQRVYSVFGNQDLLGGYMALALPLLMHRIHSEPRRRLVDFCLLTLLLSVLLLSGSRSAWLAAAVGCAVVLPWKTLRGQSRTLGAIALVALIVLSGLAVIAPAATTARVANSFHAGDVGYRARLWFWDGTARMIAGAPLLGRGLGAYAYWSPLYLGKALWAAGPEGHYRNELQAVHAHQDLLELISETGVLGATFVGWMIMRLLKCRGPEWGGLAALSVFALFNAAFHSAPHALAGVLFAGALMARCEGLASVAVPARRWAGGAVLTVSLLLAGLLTWAVFVPSVLLRTAESAHVNDRPCLLLYERVLAYPWPNAMAEKDYSFALMEAGRNQDALVHLARALRGQDTGDVYLALALASGRTGDLPEAADWARECLLRWPANETAWGIRIEAAADGDTCRRLRAQAERWLSPEAAAALPACPTHQ